MEDENFCPTCFIEGKSECDEHSEMHGECEMREWEMQEHLEWERDTFGDK
jgi:hypothetical protein